MELIFKIYEQPGRSPVIRKLEGNRITIGRAYDNDLILTDPAISPHHAVIEMDENGEMVLHDLNSLNGIHFEHIGKINGKLGLKSGTEYLIGKTRVRVYTPDYPVPDAMTIGESRRLASLLVNPLVLVTAILVVSFIYALEQWLNMFAEFKWQEIVNIELVIFGSTLLMAIFWAIIGRIFRHETNFRKQATVVLIFIAAQFVLSKFFEFLLFNTLDYGISLAVMLFIEFLLIATLLWFNLLLATNQSPLQRARTAIAVSIVIIALSMYSEMSFDSEFSNTPQYVKLLNPPPFRISGSVTEDEFLSSATVVFDRLESE
jgi:hypothetical protein